MKYYRYTFAEHGRKDSYKGSVTVYYEVAMDTSFVRAIEIFEDGIAYSYDLDHAADSFGQLPDTEMDIEAARAFGGLSELGRDDFERIWEQTSAVNRPEQS